MAYESKAYAGKKQPLLNGQFSETALENTQKLLKQPETKLL
jgi:hypothetical protein